MKYIILAIVILAISVIIYTQHNNIKSNEYLNVYETPSKNKNNFD